MVDSTEDFLKELFLKHVKFNSIKVEELTSCLVMIQDDSLLDLVLVSFRAMTPKTHIFIPKFAAFGALSHPSRLFRIKPAG